MCCVFVTVHTICYLISLPSQQLLGYSNPRCPLWKHPSYFRSPSFLLTSFTVGSRLLLSTKAFGIFATSLLRSPNDRFIVGKQVCCFRDWCRNKEGGLSSIPLSLFSLIFLSRFAGLVWFVAVAVANTLENRFYILRFDRDYFPKIQGGEEVAMKVSSARRHLQWLKCQRK